MEHQEIYEWLKELAFKNCDKENREQIFWFFEDILEDEIKVEKQEEEIESQKRVIDGMIDNEEQYCLEINRLNNIIDKLEKWIDEESKKIILSTGHLTCLMMCKNKLQELKGSDKE